ncbi:hypothetical protein AB0I53_42995 [Saccharopolyspora sp. NPDC050389]|uniref:hypothetical protein n=1 Tax=Saccharopolyspora sp. NPDC050389 TaxID=3155516 RepID=UPI0033CDB3F1
MSLPQPTAITIRRSTATVVSFLEGRMCFPLFKNGFQDLGNPRKYHVGCSGAGNYDGLRDGHSLAHGCVLHE